MRNVFGSYGGVKYLWEEKFKCSRERALDFDEVILCGRLCVVFL